MGVVPAGISDRHLLVMAARCDVEQSGRVNDAALTLTKARAARRSDWSALSIAGQAGRHASEQPVRLTRVLDRLIVRGVQFW